MPKSHKAETVKFTRSAVCAFLDGCIRMWRDKRDDAERRGDREKLLMSRCYVDAFQSVRTSVFGKTLPPARNKVRTT